LAPFRREATSRGTPAAKLRSRHVPASRGEFS
jgi:hypothetical protein